MKNTCLKLLFLVAFLFSFNNDSFSQSGQWVWMKGDNTTSSAGNYGTKGVSSPTNEPEARYQCAYWIDKQGDFWVFGGYGNSGCINDMWRYKISTNEWTWMNGPQGTTNPSGVYGTKGVPSPLNYPDAIGFGSNCWTDSAGFLWLFGGAGGVNPNCDNLWKYNTTTNEWTWVNGSGIGGNTTGAVYGTKGVYASTNSPNGLQEVKSGWVIGNELWMFGGMGQMGTSNNLWSYNISTDQWAWQSGGQGVSTGNFGTKGVSSPTNLPPGRGSYTKWKDGKNNLFIFGGIDFSITGMRNDVWKFDMLTKEWTWVSGTNVIDDPGTFPNYCDPKVTEIPSSRYENQSAQTASSCVNAFWTFGGFITTGSSFHNDLWLFNTENYEWTKVSGETMVSTIPYSNYGTQGVLAATNMIPPRGGHGTWSDAQGNFWVFGGAGGQAATFMVNNDLWKFIPDTSCFNTGLIGGVELTPPTQTSVCPGDTIHYLLPGNVTITIQPNTNNFYDVVNKVIHIYGGGTYTVTATSLNPNDPCFVNDTITFTITGFSAPDAAFSASPQVAIIGEGNFSFVNQSTNATSYEWYYQGNLISTNTDLNYSFNSIGTHCVDLVAIGNCDLKDTVQHCVEVLEDGSIFFPNAFTPNGDTKNETFGPVLKGNIKLNSFLIFNRFGENVYNHKSNSNGWDGTYKGDKCEMGVYFYVAEVVNAFGKKIIYKGDITLLK
ncbi:MAG: gliding motility-associated C-terminal domain-containing protein [Chitinophagaceae bacterium]|nr:gliding motility-associated C-terminal domain-containing protein [Chitinophagaceae bacterium]